MQKKPLIFQMVPESEFFCIARALVLGEIVIGKLEIGKYIAHLSYNGILNKRCKYEVLENVGNTALEWVLRDDKILPMGEVEGGFCRNEYFKN